MKKEIKERKKERNIQKGETNKIQKEDVNESSH